jgi:hypothetical protein
VGGANAFAHGAIDGRELWNLLSRPSADLASLLRQVDIPEILARQNASKEKLALSPPLLLITLPHVHSHPSKLLAEICDEVLTYPRAPVAQQFSRLFRWLCVHLQRTLWIERSGSSLEYVERLISSFANACFIHIVRDGRQCAYSMSKHPFFRVKLARLLTRLPALSIARCLEYEVPVDRFGTYWSALMLKQARALHRLGSRVLLLRYEDLTDDPARELSRVARFMVLPESPTEWLAIARERVVCPSTPLAGLPALERLKLERACLPGMRVLERLR